MACIAFAGLRVCSTIPSLVLTTFYTSCKTLLLLGCYLLTGGLQMQVFLTALLQGQKALLTSRTAPGHIQEDGLHHQGSAGLVSAWFLIWQAS